MKNLAAAFAMLLWASQPALAQNTEAAITKRATELRETPGDSGRSLAALPAQAPITRLGERQGPWLRVRSEAGATGWLHLFDVGPAVGAASGATAGALRGVTNLVAGPTNTTVPTSTIGMRGLSAEDLARAQPNPAAVRQMEGLRQDEAQARDFASSAALRAVPVDPLPAPAAGGGTQ